MEESLTLELPLEDVVKFNGLSFDVGSSVWKLIYLPKEDWTRICTLPERPKLCTVKIAFLSNVDIETSLSFIEENCAIIRDEGEETQLYCTGLTLNQQIERFKNKLGCKLVLLSEGDCFANALKYLTDTVPLKDLIHGPIPSVEEHLAKIRVMFESFGEFQKQENSDMEFHSLEEYDDTKTRTELGTDDVPLAESGSGTSVYPCLLVVGGSGFGWMNIPLDGRWCIQNMVQFGGRFFLGLASLLCGVHTWGELLALVEEGNSKNVDVNTSDFVIQKELSNDIYATMLSGEVDSLVYSFGKAAGKTRGDFSKADIARTLMSTVCISVAQHSLWTALRTGIKNIFMSGSFVCSPIARTIISTRIEEDKMQATALIGKGASDIKCYFLKSGSHLGAIGAAANKITNWIPLPKTQDDAGDAPITGDASSGDAPAAAKTSS